MQSLKPILFMLFIAFLAPCHAMNEPADAQAQAATAEENSAEFALLARTQFIEPLFPTGASAPGEDADLLQAIRQYRTRTSPDDYQALTGFLNSHPQSVWQVALLTNLGLAYYQDGRFTLAIDAWENAWRLGKDATEPHAKVLVDRALGELMRMHARIGHAERLQALFAEMGDRPVSGPATEDVTGAREGLWVMRNNPGIAYLCGPMALKNLLLSQGASAKDVEFIDQVRSGPNGFSLTEVGKLAQQAKLPYTLIKRDASEPVPVPSVVHWKVSHYAAIIGENAGRYHIKDPIFGEDLWVSRDAIDQEASGYYLVPTKKLQPGWETINLAVADTLHGMGYTSDVTPGNTTPNDDKSKPCGGIGDIVGNAINNIGNAISNLGMCGYNFSEMVVSLNLTDSPVGYRPAIGPSMFTTLTYNQRDAGQPANFGFFNVSQKWTLNWLTYIQDTPGQPGANVTRYVAGGGFVNYSGYNGANGQFTPETTDQSVLVLSSANPIVYKRLLQDGSVEVYAQSNGATTGSRLVFMTQLIDPQGNAVNFNYDNQLRLTSLIDATGRVTSFAYGLGASPLLITQITDPFGRSAHLAYDNQGRLSSITDVYGLQSSFQYDNSSLINSLTTPYGTTTFQYGGTGVSRYLQATDPLGYTERLEFLQQAPGIPYSDPASTVPQGILAPFNVFLNGRDTFYWDKSAYQRAAGNYTQARNKHWTHWAQNTGETTSPVESIKYPLENRIWFNYPGQPNSGLGTAVSGSYNQPSIMGRVLDDGSTQLTQKSYNSLGRVTSITDPVGRVTEIVYAQNQIDPVQILQQTAGGLVSLGQYTFNNKHQPLTHTDASGQTTAFAYNNAGQLTQLTDALNETTTFSYDPHGNLLKITDANGKTKLTLTYDAYNRVASRTDSEGYTLKYYYDNLDRITKIAYPDGTAETLKWNKLDLAAITDRQGRQTQYKYDSVRNLIEKIDPLGHKTLYSYNPNQTVASVTDPNGNVTRWSRDIESRITAKHYPDGKFQEFTYENTSRRLKSITDGLDQVKSFTYTKDNRISQINYINSVNKTPNVAFSYDPWFPRITIMKDGNGVTTYQYAQTGVNGALKVSKVDGPYLNDTVAFQYDPAGRIHSRTVDTAAETLVYDDIGRLVGHNNPLGNFNLSYLGESNQITGLTSASINDSWQFDVNQNDRRLLAIANTGASRGYSLVTEPGYLISQINESATASSAWAAKNWTYGYDNDNRLLSAQSSTGDNYAYVLDNADNLTQITANAATTNLSVNELNQITAAGANNFSYDANGNLLNDGVRTYLWDAENRLLQINIPAQPGIGYKFRYDGFGHRIAVIFINGSTSMETRYLWCGKRICQSRNANDQVIRRYYSEGEYLAQTASGLVYNTDQAGSVRDAVDSKTAALSVSYDYDPYGNPVRSKGAASTDFRYAGQFYLPNANLYLTQFRPYDPVTGRWLARDPLGEKVGNLYSYAKVNPVSFTDPTGLWTLNVGFSGSVGYWLGLNCGGGFIIDSSGNYGTYSTGGGGFVTPGANLGISVGFMGSVGNETTTISDFGGPFVNGSIGGGADGLAGSVDGFIDPNKPQNFGGGFTFGVGTPGVGGSVTVTNTIVNQSGNIFNDLNNLNNAIINAYGGYGY